MNAPVSIVPELLPDRWWPAFLLPTLEHDHPQPDPSILALRSSMTTQTWRCAITGFNGFANTLPAFEADDLDLASLVSHLAPDQGPQVIREKKKGTYVIPSLLADKPLVGLTLKRAEARGLETVGKQRSRSHVTTSRLARMEFDDLSEEQARKILQRLIGAGIAFIAYSTHSHGTDEHVRLRLWLPIDIAVDRERYQRLMAVINRLLCDDLGDESALPMYQQQGIWMVHPDRQGQAFRLVHPGHLLSIAALEQHVELPSPVHRSPSIWIPGAMPAFSTPVVAGPVHVNLKQLAAALLLWDPEPYASWMRACMCLKALLGHAPTEILYDLWMRFCARGSARATARNHEDAYSPQRLFVEGRALMPAEQALRTLYAVARDNGLALLRESCNALVPTDRLELALTYLKTYHRKALDQFLAEYFASKEAA